MQEERKKKNGERGKEEGQKKSVEEWGNGEEKRREEIEVKTNERIVWVWQDKSVSFSHISGLSFKNSQVRGVVNISHHGCGLRENQEIYAGIFFYEGKIFRPNDHKLKHTL